MRNIIQFHKCSFANLSDRLYRISTENPGNYCLSGDGSDHGGAMASLTIDVDLPPGVNSPATAVLRTAMASRSIGPYPSDAGAKNVVTRRQPASSSKRRPKSFGTSTSGTSPVLDLSGSVPSLWAVQLPPAHHSPVQTQGRVLHLRFEQFVLRSLIGSTAEEVRRGWESRPRRWNGSSRINWPRTDRSTPPCDHRYRAG